ncbi:MAG: hypothetical protein NVSMB13_05450 [Mycobacteriales bacterium]
MPRANLAEARLVPGVSAVGVDSLRALLALLRGLPGPADEGDEPAPPEPDPSPFALDLTDVAGQASGRWALEVAAAGGHHLYLWGPPGAGKTMLAERLPGLPRSGHGCGLGSDGCALGGRRPAGLRSIDHPAAVPGPAPHGVGLGAGGGWQRAGPPGRGEPGSCQRAEMFLDIKVLRPTRCVDGYGHPRRRRRAGRWEGVMRLQTSPLVAWCGRQGSGRCTQGKTYRDTHSRPAPDALVRSHQYLAEVRVVDQPQDHALRRANGRRNDSIAYLSHGRVLNSPYGQRVVDGLLIIATGRTTEPMRWRWGRR